MEDAAVAGGGGARVACRDMAVQLAACVEGSPCVAGGRSIMDCIKSHELGSTECDVLRRAYYDCRRSQLDMRTRIQGRKHADSGKS